MSGTSIERVKDRACDLLARWDAALEAGEITEERWFQEIQAVITPAYLAGDNPRAQSGHSGDEARWAYARSLIADGIDKDGTFLDVGCASGLLMECLPRWARERGFAIEPYGLDMAPELAALARRRLPHWAERIHVGNALYWEPPMRFACVRTGLEYVPRHRRRDLVDRLLREVVAPGGRLIIGAFPEETEARSWEEMVAGWGFRIAGRSERPHRDERLMYRVFWVE